MPKQIKRLSVGETVATIIRNWPSSYYTRLDALRRVFTASGDNWFEGEDGMYPLPEIVLTASVRDEVAAEEKEIAEKLRGRDINEVSAYTRSEISSIRLYHRRERARNAFNRENAELIAAERFAGFTYIPTFSTTDLNALPLANMAPDWREALVEFCNEIHRYTEIEARYQKRQQAPQYQQQGVDNLNRSKDVATECLHRLGQGDKADEKVRAAAIEKLRAAAAEYGMKLVDENSVDH
jgi:hypothetical protein